MLDFENCKFLLLRTMQEVYPTIICTNMGRKSQAQLQFNMRCCTQFGFIHRVTHSHATHFLNFKLRGTKENPTGPNYWSK